MQRHLMLRRDPRHQIEQQLADRRAFARLVPHEMDDFGVAGQGLVLEDDVVEDAVEAGVLELGAADAFGEDVEADDAGVVAAGGVEGGMVEPVLEPVEDFEFGEAVGELVGVGRGGGEGGEGGAEVGGVVHEELFVDDEDFGAVGVADVDADDFLVEVSGRGGSVDEFGGGRMDPERRNLPGGRFSFEGAVKRLVKRIRFHSGCDVDCSDGRLGHVVGKGPVNDT